MNKTVIISTIFVAVAALCGSCGKKDPRLMGAESGKAQCECYKLEGEEAVKKCLDDIEKKYTDYLNDTAYIEASELQMLNCISEGVVDMDKPIKDFRDTTKKAPTADIQSNTPDSNAQNNEKSETTKK